MNSRKLKHRPAAVEDFAPRLALVVPALQEAGNLPELLRRVLAALDEVPVHAEVIVVDDDSGDGTLEIVRAAARLDPRVRILVRKGERGLAGAVLHGWRHSDADVLAVMDADLQHPPEILPRLFGAMLRGADVAVASRYKCGGSTGQWNAARRFVSSSATWMTRPLMPRRLRVNDPMSGFFMIRRECVEGLRLQTTGFKLLLELLVRAQVSRVEEVSFEFGVRHAGRSKASLSVAREYARLLLRLYVERNSDRNARRRNIDRNAGRNPDRASASRTILPARMQPVPQRSYLRRDHADHLGAVEPVSSDRAVPELVSLVLQ